MEDRQPVTTIDFLWRGTLGPGVSVAQQLNMSSARRDSTTGGQNRDDVTARVSGNPRLQLLTHTLGEGVVITPDEFLTYAER